MITLSASGGSVTFTFDGNSTYLNDGQITVPVNSLALIIDESDMATFRKAASNDIFVSANIAEFGMTKDELIAWYKANMVGSTGGGGGGVTSGEVQTMIDESISGKVDADVYSAFTSNTNTALFKIDNRLIDTERKLNSAWTKSIRDVSWYPNARGLTLSYSILSGGSFQYISQPLDESLKFDNNNKLGVYTTGSTYTVGGNQYVPGGARYTLPISNALKTKKVVIQLNQSYTGSTPTSNAIQAFYYDNNGVSYNPKWNYDSDLDSFTNSTEYTGITLTYDQVGKTITLELDSSYAYISQIRTAKNIAPADDLTNERYYIGLITVYTNEYKLQDVLDSMTGSTSGKVIEGGRGISVTTGATADTVSFNLPISAGTGTYSIQENTGTALGDYSHAEGSNTTAYGDYSHAEGYNTMAISAYSHTEGWQTQANGLAAHAEGYTTRANGENSHAEGNITETKNLGEHASGSYNLSHKASNTFGDSGNTLFSVGNGTSTGTSRHNAFEIRQNGDIYFEYDGSDVKLQDKLDEIESVTAAALNNLNDRFGGLSLVKLTQTEYDNLQTKDSNTLYVIVN